MPLFGFISFSGVIATALDWTYDAGTYSYGEIASVNFDVTVSTTEDSRNVNGLGLWRVGVFASTQADGSGRREAENTQILDAYNQGQALNPPIPLNFDVNGVRFNMNPLGCESYRYLCVEFTKRQGSDPDFAFQTATGGDRLVSCKEVQCQSKLLFSALINLIHLQSANIWFWGTRNFKLKSQNLLNFQTDLFSNGELPQQCANLATSLLLDAWFFSSVECKVLEKNHMPCGSEVAGSAHYWRSYLESKTV